MAEWADFTETMVRARYHEFEFAVTRLNSEGKEIAEPIDVFLDIVFTVKKKVTDSDADAVMILKRTDGDLEDVDGPGGIGRVKILETKTTALSVERTHTLYAEVAAIDASNRSIPLMQGRLVVGPNLAQTLT
jgi:hypothetical protein